MSLTSVLARSRNDREAWRYTDLAALLPAACPPSEASQTGVQDAIDRGTLPSVIEEPSLRLRLAFVDGIFDPLLSHGGEWPTGLRVEAKGSHCSITAEVETCLVTAPLELVFFHRRGLASYLERNTQLHISLGESSRLTLIEHHFGEDNCAAVHVAESFITLDPHAKLSHAMLFHRAPAATCLARTEAHLAKGAFYRHFALIKDTKLVRNELLIGLEGEQAQTTLDGAMLLRAREHADTYIKVLHAAPYATSRQFYKSIVQDRAKGAFQGKILVEPAGQHADARQTCRALLLSDQAEMNAKPELEIYADDVQCSHGCATGTLDDDALFYLRSRGLSESQAHAMLLRAFVDEIMNESHAGECSTFAQSLAERWFDDAS
ncbi:MAG: SufD family Fe-S cluster assembly protein [Bdellovibrionales bacterium]